MKSIFSFFSAHRHQLLVVFFVVCLFFLNTCGVFADNHPPATVAAAAAAEDNGSWLGNKLADLVVGLALGIGGLFAALGGALLNGAIYYTVISAGLLLGDNSALGIGTGIREMWKVTRDIFNIVFIFSFIFIGIKTILNADDSGAKRSLGLLIVAALLINFSLYFSQVIIDFTNIAATQVYNQIASGAMLADQLPDDASEQIDYGIAGAFQKTLSLNNFFDNGIAAAGQVALYAILSMFFLIIAGVVFAMGGILLIKRFVVLIIYMVLSPFMFAGWIFPAFMSYQERWRKEFLRQAFFAPAFLFMIYLSLAALQSMQNSFGIEEEGYKEVIATGDVSVFSIFLFFCVGIGFLYGSIKIGDMMGAAGASGMLKSLDAMKGMAQSFAYRNTVGRGMRQGIKVLDALDRAADNKKGLAGFSARTARFFGADEALRRGAEGIQNKSINGGRGLEAVEKDEKTAKARGARETAVRKTTADMENADRGVRERAVADASSAQLLEMLKTKEGKKLLLDNADMLSDSQFESIIKSDDATDAYRSEIGRSRGEKVADRLVADNKVQKKDAAGNLMFDATGNPVYTKLVDVISKADTSQLKSIGFDSVLPYAGKLTAKQIEDWKDLTVTQKNQLKDTRNVALKSAFNTDPNDFFKKQITSDEERSKLSWEILTDERAAEYLNTNVLNKIPDNSKITDEHRKDIKRHILTRYALGSPHEDSDKFDFFEDWFKKNNAGQRY